MVPKRFWNGPKAFARILDWFEIGFGRILGDPGVFLEWFRSAMSLRWLWACLEWFRSDTDVVLQWFWGCFEMVPKWFWNGSGGVLADPGVILEWFWSGPKQFQSSPGVVLQRFLNGSGMV
jgi:hypothetical protein